MLRLFLLSSAALALGPGPQTLPAPPPPPPLEAPSLADLRFTLEPRDDDRVQLALTFGAGESGRARGSHSGPQRWSALEGLDAAALRGPAGRPVAFRLDREAGDILCAGETTGAGAAGTCRFTPDAGFSRALQGRTGEAPAEGDLFHLALASFSLDTLSELDRQGYARPALADIVAAAIHRVDAAYVREMAEAGHRLGSLDRLTALHIHRVTPDYIAAMAALGPSFRALSADQLMALRIHRVTPEGARALAAAGYPKLSVDQHMAFAIHRVSPAFIREMADAGYRDLSAEQLISLRIRGVTSSYARAMARLDRSEGQ